MTNFKSSVILTLISISTLLLSVVQGLTVEPRQRTDISNVIHPRISFPPIGGIEQIGKEIEEGANAAGREAADALGSTPDPASGENAGKSPAQSVDSESPPASGKTSESGKTCDAAGNVVDVGNMMNDATGDALIALTTVFGVGCLVLGFFLYKSQKRVKAATEMGCPRCQKRLSSSS
ncbi:hypothetical protein PM082_007150 [Marasmius tenuissimus]|nr:hypothetical protein PM082_007150 [Marasmius tenuissimus]